MYHKLIQRQLKKYSTEDLEEIPAFKQWIEVVNEAYLSYEKDKELSEHAFLTSQNEFNEINTLLKEEVELRKQSIRKLKETLLSLQPVHNPIDFEQQDDIFNIVQILDIEIKKRKEVEDRLLNALEEVKKSSQIKSEFLSVMSHEIRTPLNAIIGMGHLLLKNNPKEEQIENLNVLKISADNLLILINNILDFNKIEAGKLEMEELHFDLRKLIQDIFLALTPSAEERNNHITINIEETIPGFFKGDYIRLNQVINNLVSNAIKFTRNGSIVFTLKLLSHTESIAKLYFSVEDSGVGIAPNKLKDIFSPFTQESTSTTREYGGTGLGLTITKNILSLFNSTIEVESIPGKGSTFYFTLDLKTIDPKENDLQFQKETLFDLKAKKILLVEDSQYNIFYATQLLESWNAKVEIAIDGQKGLEKMEEGHFDLVLMDLHMPVMDGYTCTERIRMFNKSTPIIALTASATNNVYDKVKNIGMQDYVTKPFNPDDLFYKIKKCLLI